jgi:hypothetical protein
LVNSYTDTDEIRTVAEKASLDPANRRQKLELVWKIERKLAKLSMNTLLTLLPIISFMD